jgi:ABC-type dipeptide/oligopeptide/nickel transport system permease component
MMASPSPRLAGRTPRPRIAAALVLMVLLAAFAFWIGGLPVLILWGLSKVTRTSAHHFVLGLIAVPAAMAWFGLLLIRLNGIYLRLAGDRPPEGRAAGGRAGGPLEALLVPCLVLAVVALVVWFFVLAHGPPRQFI